MRPGFMLMEHELDPPLSLLRTGTQNLPGILLLSHPAFDAIKHTISLEQVGDYFSFLVHSQTHMVNDSYDKRSRESVA